MAFQTTSYALESKYERFLDAHKRDIKVTIKFQHGWPNPIKVVAVPDITNLTLKETLTIQDILHVIKTEFSGRVLEESFLCDIPEDIKELHVCTAGIKNDEDSMTIYAPEDLLHKWRIDVWEVEYMKGSPPVAKPNPVIRVIMKEPKVKRTLRKGFQEIFGPDEPPATE